MPSPKSFTFNLIWFKLALVKMRVHGSTDDVGKYSSRLVLEVEKAFFSWTDFPFSFIYAYSELWADSYHLQFILVRKLPFFIINL